ncbi:transport system permease protein [Bacillus cytotoxicus NVH 391-98]|uniref:Transport system permease protein n=2 Tax=Bacillus cytotoxicus TaxID=580165 RepID=A7GKQ9_BACCN|nr:transport system permease protein [Bacillus cytotoxicus NVH 391-98]
MATEHNLYHENIMKKRYLFIMLIVLSVASIFIGVKDVSLTDVLHWNQEKMQIVFISRLPRLISIIVAGVSLSISGLIMQQLSRNKFVSPTTAGTMDSAKLGVLVSLMLFTTASPLEKMFIAFIFALAGTFLFMQILKRIKFKDAIFIPLVIIAFLYANRFTVAGMGEDFAANLGMNYNRVLNIGLIIVSLISALVVLTVGMIPFLGLIIPNIVSIYRGDHLKNSLPHTALLGAVFVLACDILGRVVIYPYEISIGLTVGVIGSGIFLYLLMRRNAYAT